MAFEWLNPRFYRVFRWHARCYVEGMSDNETQNPSTRPCRCCGKPVPRWIDSDQREWRSICTRCIPKHWTKHVNGRNASRCKEFGT